MQEQPFGKSRHPQAIPLISQPGMTPEIGRGAPYIFTDVTFQIFPLRANPVQLAWFVNTYLNILPPSVAFFRPSAPFVNLILSNYGRMGQPAQRLGFLSQSEVLFSIPIDRFQRINGRDVYRGSGSVAPLLYVSDIFALMTGRELFGWEKFPGHFEPTVQPWETDPNADNPVVTLESSDLSQNSQNGYRNQTLLRVQQKAPWDPMQWPWMPDPRLSWPLETAKNISAWFDQLSQLAMPPAAPGPTTGHHGASPSANSATGGIASSLSGVLSKLTTPSAFLSRDQSLYTLKQFRSAERPVNTCYQAVIESRTQIQRIANVGLLGGPHQLAGDLSGGFKIDLFIEPAQPVLSSLGLDVSQWIKSPAKPQTDPDAAYRSSPSPASNSAVVARLRPVMPFWMKFDFSYVRSDVVAWRNETSAWFTQRDRHMVEVGSPAPGGNRFNTVLSPAPDQQSGPFIFEAPILRLIPLPANRARLKAHCLQLNFEGSPFVFDLPEGPCTAYLRVVSSESALFPSGKRSQWSLNLIDVGFVARWTYRPSGGSENSRQGWAFLHLFCFTNEPMNAIRCRDAAGLPATAANIYSPAVTWSEVDKAQPLLSLLVPSLPSIGLQSNAVEVPLLEVIRPARKSDQPSARPSRQEPSHHGLHVNTRHAAENPFSAHRPSEKPLHSGVEGSAQTSWLQDVMDSRPVSSVVLKQIPSTEGSFSQAAYQSLVQIVTRLRQPHVTIERSPLMLRIFDRSMYPLLNCLDLNFASTDDAAFAWQTFESGDKGTFHDFLIPYYRVIRAASSEWQFSLELMSRDSQTPWRQGSRPFFYGSEDSGHS